MTQIPIDADQKGDIYKRMSRARFSVEAALRGARQADKTVVFSKLVSQVTLQFAVPKLSMQTAILEIVAILGATLDEDEIFWVPKVPAPLPSPIPGVLSEVRQDTPPQ